ncbi:MAG: hypothetical protein RLY78_3864 [Pseudomonadota bacterium]
MPASDPAPTLKSRLQSVWSLLRPMPLSIDRRERWRVVLTAALGVALAATLARWWPPAAGLPWLMAPLGASAVLVFALPASPLAQPWAVIGGNTVAAWVGLACVHGLPGPWPWVAAAAVAGAIAAMLALRCLHPPGGAVALLTVVGRISEPTFALDPVALDSVLLVLAGALLNPLGGRRYPHPQGVSAPATGLVRAWDFDDEDLQRVLARHNQIVDLPRDDLRELLAGAEQQALQRRMGALRCSDAMTPVPITVSHGTPLDEAWALLQRSAVKALPVVDRFGHVLGIVTRADFLRASDLDTLGPAGLGQRLRRLITPTPGMHSDKPEVVGQIMTRQVRVTSADRPLADLLPLFSHAGHHHLPVLGPDRRLVGILTQTDVVAALARLGG